MPGVGRAVARMLRARRNRRAAVVDELWTQALEQHPIVRGLSDEHRGMLKERTSELLSRISIDRARGVAADPGMRLSVGLQAALPVLELGVDWYRAVRTILLVPYEYETELTTVDEAGVIHEGMDTVSGEVGHQRPVVLSVADVEASGWGDGYNVVIHEMAHVLDATNGELDGMPMLPPQVDAGKWRSVWETARRDHERRVRRAERAEATGRAPTVKPPVVDPYGAEGPEEFFACAAELFFERPRRLAKAYPALFEELVGFFGFDPAGE
jgi:hypothetical protein